MARLGGMAAVLVAATSIGAGVPARAQPVRPAGEDQPLAAEIQSRLRADPELSNNRIAVRVDRGVATLSGKVDSEREKSDAAQVARDNRLEVGGSAGARRAAADGAVTAEIKGKLAAAGASEFGGVSVTTDDGVVTLRGSVPDRDGVTAALEIVRHAPGVAGIENELTVAPP
jgi:osmotically-inducible protein OsmY